MSKLIAYQIPFTRKLTDDGLPAGNANAKLDYSAAPAEFYYQPAADEIVAIKYFTAHVEGNSALDPLEFASIAKLTNGVEIYLSNEAVGTATYSLTGNQPIRQNCLWSSHCTDSDVWGAVVASQKCFHARWDLCRTFDKDGLILSGAQNMRIACYMSDDTSAAGVVQVQFLVHGVFLKQEAGHAYLENEA